MGRQVLLPGLVVGLEETEYVLERCWVSKVHSQMLWLPDHYDWPGTARGLPGLSNPSPMVLVTKDAEPLTAVNSARPGRWPQPGSPAGALQWEVGQP